MTFAHTSGAQAYLRIGEPDKAIEDCSSALALDPRHANVSTLGLTSKGVPLKSVGNFRWQFREEGVGLFGGH